MREWWRKAWVVVVVVVLTLVTHGVNLWGFPYFENDEGVYTAQGWWTVEYGELAPYTYWYDHSPFGWLQVGMWQKMTGGPFTLGFSLYSTRVMMLLVAGVSGGLVAYITRKLTGSNKLALVAGVVFAMSPMGIYFHRRVLLDNLMTLWLLVSMAVLVASGSNLVRMAVSGLAFGLAFLSKESVVFLMPVMAIGVWMFGRKENRWFAMAIWIVTACFWISLFPVLALIKREFFPVGWLFSSEGPHVSFIDALRYQAGRGVGKAVWDLGNPFWSNMKGWFVSDPILLALGVWGMVVGIAEGRRNKMGLWVALLIASFMAFLARGGVVFNFYITPLVALFAIGLGCSLSSLRLTLGWEKKGSWGWVGLVVLVLGAGLVAVDTRPYVRDETARQLEGLKYAKENLPENAVLAIDNFGFIDYRLPDSPGAKVFPNAEWFYKIERDPEVRKDKLDERWENIDYLVLSHEMLTQMKIGELPFLLSAYEHAALVRDFPPDKRTFRELGSLNSTNGDWATILAVKGERERKTLVSQLGSIGEGVEELVTSMTLEEKVGQLVWGGLTGSKFDDEAARYVNEVPIGGVVLYGGNVAGETQLINLLGDVKLRSARKNEALKPLIAVDQEGGDVSRIWFLPESGLAQGDVRDEEQAYVVGQRRGLALSRLGVDINLAPVVDVAQDGGSYISRSKRSFSGGSGSVAAMGVAMLTGMRDGGVVSVVKHFPGGLGRVKTDPHLGLPVVEFGVESVGGDELPMGIKEDLVPFEKAIEAGVKAVMVTHLSYPEIDGYPASLSRVWVEEILREKMGFGGVVVVDDVSMGALDKYTDREKAERFYESGADVMIVSGEYERQRNLYRQMVELVREGVVDEGRVDESVGRMLGLRGGELN